MNAVVPLLFPLLFFALGACAAWLHGVLLWRGVQGAVRAESPRGLLLGAPLRILIPAGCLLAASLWGGLALVGALVGFGLGGLATRWRLAGLSERSPA